MSFCSRFFSFIVTKNSDGLRGLMGAKSPADGGMISLVGVDETGISGGDANLPVEVDGSGIFLTADGVYALKIEPGAISTPHYLLLGDPFLGPRGLTYSPLQIGPELPREQIETFTDAADFSLTPENTTQEVVSGTLAATYIATTTFAWECQCDNRGDRAADFSIQPMVDAVPLGPPTVVTLSLGDQLVTGNVEFIAPPVAGAVVSLEVTSQNWAQPTRPNPFVSGTINPSTIVVFQVGATSQIEDLSISGDGTQVFADATPEVLALANVDHAPSGWVIASDEITPLAVIPTPLMAAFAVTVEASSKKEFELRVSAEADSGGGFFEVFVVSQYGRADSMEAITVACPMKRFICAPGNVYRVLVTCTQIIGSGQTYTVIPNGTWLTVVQGYR